MLSAQQVEDFCRTYIELGNATESYVRAIPRAVKWKRRSAARKAVDMMRRPEVLARIEELDQIMRRQSEAQFIADLEEEHRERRRESRGLLQCRKCSLCANSGREQLQQSTTCERAASG